MKSYLCFYCNDYGESKDHVPPVSCSDVYEEDQRYVVRCCLLCNSLLGSRALLSFLARNDYLLIKYECRFKKLLSMPYWSTEEISELKGKLKRKIIMTIKKKKYIENKILFIKQNISILQGY
jgi:hypothetical protein